jgi:hypothetical protein
MAREMLKVAKYLLANKQWPKGMKAIDWLIKDFGEFDVDFQDDYFPTKGVLGNRAKSSQHDEIMEIGRGLVSAAESGNTGFEIYTRARDKDATLEVLNDLFKKAGMKTKLKEKDGKRHSLVVIYDKKRISEAQRAMQKYHEWIALQRMR